METIFMNTENSTTNEPYRFKLNLTHNLNLKNPNKDMALANLSIYYNWKNTKSEYITINLKFQHQFGMIVLVGFFSISDIQDYFEFIIKKHETLTENPPFKMYPKKTKNRIVIKIKTRYKLELLTPETMKLLGRTKKDVDSDKNSENIPKLESVEIALVHYNLVKNDYQYTSKFLFSFVPNKQFGQLINISPNTLIMMNTVNTEFSFVEVWFTDQISKALEIEHNVNLTLIIG